MGRVVETNASFVGPFPGRVEPPSQVLVIVRRIACGCHAAHTSRPAFFAVQPFVYVGLSDGLRWSLLKSEVAEEKQVLLVNPNRVCPGARLDSEKVLRGQRSDRNGAGTRRWWFGVGNVFQ